MFSKFHKKVICFSNIFTNLKDVRPILRHIQEKRKMIQGKPLPSWSQEIYEQKIRLMLLYQVRS